VPGHDFWHSAAPCPAIHGRRCKPGYVNTLLLGENDMKLSRLNVNVFFSCVNTVCQKLDDPEARSDLLEKARSDTPIIEGLIQRVALLHAMKNHGKSHPEAILMAHRDLVVFLALREMERREQASRMRRRS